PGPAAPGPEATRPEATRPPAGPNPEIKPWVPAEPSPGPGPGQSYVDHQPRPHLPHQRSSDDRS
ncbi:hypothetical protein AB0G46_21995, partial [Streptomyces sp. NPDC020667]